MINILFVLISIISGFFFALSVVKITALYEFWVILVIGLVSYIACIVIYLLVIAIMSLFVTTKKKYTKQNKFYYFMVREACDFICNFLRVRVHIRGKEKLPKDSNFLLVGNHISGLDPILIIGTFKSRVFGAISKPENIKMPFIGKIIYRTFILPIDRENPRNAVGTIVQAGDLIKNTGINMILYPEGTRNKTGVGLLPFKNGGFKIAQKAGVPIVVVNTIGSNKVLKRFPFSTKVSLDIVDVIYPKDYEGLNTNDIGDKVRESILGYKEEKVTDSLDAKDKAVEK